MSDIEGATPGSARINKLFGAATVVPEPEPASPRSLPSTPKSPKPSDIETGKSDKHAYLTTVSRVTDGGKSKFDQFVEKEHARRAASNDRRNPFFISHCWKNPDSRIQDRKWQVIDILSCPLNDPSPRKAGIVYWADWLDLQAQGPVAWRQEIELGIKNSSKVIAFIDSWYLRSPNCLQELAYLRHFKKPVVVFIQDQAAFDVITKSLRAGALEAWGDGSDERHLCRWEGMDLVPGEVTFSLQVLQELYQMVANINCLAMRESDFASLGEGPLLDKMLSYVQKDLAHVKAHARWLQRAQEWDRLGRPRFALLRTVELRDFEHWMLDAAAKSVEPHPTPLHQEYLRASLHRERRSRSLWVTLGIVVFACVLGLAGFSAYKAVDATHAKESALQAKAAAALEAAEGKVDLLVTTALAFTDLDPSFSLQLAAEAVHDALALGEHYRVQGKVAQVLAATRDSSSSPSLELWGHNNTVVALTHSGSLYMTGSLDNTSRLYTSNGTLQCVFSGEQEGGAVNAVAMSSAFGLGITGSADGYIRMYNVTTCAFLAKVKGPHRSSITAISTNDPSTPESETQVNSNRPAEPPPAPPTNSSPSPSASAASPPPGSGGNNGTPSSPPARNGTNSTAGPPTAFSPPPGNNATGGTPPGGSAPPAGQSPPLANPSPAPAGSGGSASPPTATQAQPPAGAGPQPPAGGRRRDLLQTPPPASAAGGSGPPTASGPPSGGGGGGGGGGSSQYLVIATGDSTGTVAAWVLNLALALSSAGNFSALLERTGVTHISVPGQVSALKITSAGDEVVIAGTGALLSMWDIQSNRVTNFTGHRGEVSAVAMSDDGGLIVSGGRDRSIRVWATGSKNNRSDNSWTTAISTNGAVTDVKLSGEDYIVSGEADGYVRIYSTATGAMTTNTRCWLKGNTKYSPGAVMRVALQNTNITTSGKARKFNDVQFACTRDDNAFAVYNGDAPAKSDTSLQLTGHTDAIASLSFSSSGDLVASASYDGTIKVWSAKYSPANGGGQFSSLLPNYVSGSTSKGIALAVAFSPVMNSTAIAGGGNGGKVSVWAAAIDADTDAYTDLAPDFQLSGHTGSVTAVAWGRDGTLLASGSTDGTVILWNVTARSKLGTLAGVGGCGIASVAFQPAMQYVAAGDDCGTLLVWTVKGLSSFKVLSHAEGGSSEINAVRWSPVGDQIATVGSNYAVVLWSTSTWTKLSTLSGHTSVVDDAAYSADGQRLLSIGGPDGDMHLWDTAECSSGDLWPTLSSGESIGQSYTAVAISQMRVAAGDTQGTVSVQAFDPAFQMQAALSRVYKNTRITTDEKDLVLQTSTNSCNS